MRIFVFGDSIVQGFFDTHGGWVQRLSAKYNKDMLDAILSGEKSDKQVFNLGVSGDTAKGVRNRIKQEIEARRLYDDTDLVLIAVGINDACLIKNRAVNDVYTFQTDYEDCIKQALDLGAQVFCVGLSAVDEQLTDPWAGSTTGRQRKNNRINLFEDSIKQSAMRTGAGFVPVHDEFLAESNAGHELLSDGLHPNNDGHMLILKNVEELLDQYGKNN